MANGCGHRCVSILIRIVVGCFHYNIHKIHGMSILRIYRCVFRSAQTAWGILVLAVLGMVPTVAVMRLRHHCSGSRRYHPDPSASFAGYNGWA